MKEINSLLQTYEGYYILKLSGKKYFLDFEFSKEHPERFMVPVAHSLSKLMTEINPLVKKCDNPDCGIYFQDISRKKDRRWCSMQLCGNSAKARAFLARKSS